MSDTNRTSLAIIRKDSSEVVVGPTGYYTSLPITADGLKTVIDNAKSETIRSDRQVVDFIRTDMHVEGDCSFELFAKAFDELLLAALWADEWKGWDITLNGIDYSTVITVNQLRCATTGEFEDFSVGDIITVSGFTDAANNGIARVTAVGNWNAGGGEVNNVLTLEGLTLTTEAAGDAVTITVTVDQPSLTGITYSTTITTNVLESTVDGDFDEFHAGGWVLISGFTDAANNGYARILSIGDAVAGGSNNALTLGLLTLTTEAAGDTVTISPSTWIENGTTEWIFDAERVYADVAATWAFFSGLRVDGLSLSCEAGAIITGSVSFQGETETSAVATAITGTIEDGLDSEVMSGVDDVLAIHEADVESALCFTNFSVDIANNLRARGCLGSLGPQSFGTGQFEVSGSLTAYFTSHALYNKFLSWTASTLFLLLEDEDGNRYVLEMPKVNFTDGDRSVSGPNGDVTVDLSWSSSMDPTEEITMRIHRWRA